MSVVDVSHVTYRYGKRTALANLDLVVPEGALYALLGPNGSGKTTLLQLLMGLRRPHAGRVAVLGKERSTLTVSDRAKISYIAEGQQLPKWMRLEQLESYLAPLYDRWDASLAASLRERFELDPRQVVGTLSRGQRMKAALLCALAARPRLLLMDEPFTGMDALVKDELVRGLLEASGSEGWTVLLCSHDIGELEALADWVGILDGGSMRVSETMESLHARFKRVEIVTDESVTARAEWLSVERAGKLTTFITSHMDAARLDAMLRARYPDASRIDVREATLREVFVTLVRNDRAHGEAAA
jgi:ABC-type multidrug transport system ATPase subunit